MTDWPLNQPGDVTVLDVPTDILCSYHYFKEIDIGKIKAWGTRIIGDSGAFSAMSGGEPIDREEFHAWAHRWRDDLFWAAALDVIGDAEASFQNWQAAKRDGLDLVPTLHYGEGTRQIDRFAEEGATLIGLGGMVPYSSEKDRLMRWCLQMHRHARDHHPHVRFHGWGISHPFLVDNLPWWSTDSSGFSSCFRFGSLRLWDPRKGRFFSVDLNGRDLAKHARLLRETYNVDWKLISRSTPENRRPLGRVALRSVQLYASWLQRRQSVAPPALLAPKIDSAGTGPLPVAAASLNEVMTQSLGVTRPQDVPRVGPLSVGADTAGQAPSSAIRPGEDGPHVAGAMRRVGPDQIAAVSVTGNASPEVLLDPDTGPLQVGAMGGPTSAQGRSVTPTGKLIVEEVGKTND